MVPRLTKILRSMPASALYSHPSGQLVYSLDTVLRSCCVLRTADRPAIAPASHQSGQLVYFRIQACVTPVFYGFMDRPARVPASHASGDLIFLVDTGLRNSCVLRTVDRLASNYISQTFLSPLFPMADPLKLARRPLSLKHQVLSAVSSFSSERPAS